MKSFAQSVCMVGSPLEKSLGRLISGIMPSLAARLDEDAKSASLPFGADCIFASSLTISLALSSLAVAGVVALHAVDGIDFMAVALSGALCAALGWFVPQRAVAHAADARRREIARDLPFAIDLIGSAVRSGLDFGAAVRYYVGIGMGGALDEEFTLALRDVSLGRPFAEALSRMASRVKVDSVTAFASVVSYGMEIGASISRTLRLHGGELRRARFAAAERKAQRAPVVMILPLVAFIMPAVFIVILTPMVIRLAGVLK